MKVVLTRLAKVELEEAERFFESDAVIVIAIAHLHRRPDYWIDRM